jgi:predicted Fe-S protein YdhL (DUF1289 family)
MIKSPCCRNCCLDMQDVCLGCGRTYTEIIAWHSVDDEGKLIILAAAKARLAQNQQHPLGISTQTNLDNSN